MPGLARCKRHYACNSRRRMLLASCSSLGPARFDRPASGAAGNWADYARWRVASGNAWKLVIDTQDGAAFSGNNTGPSGKPKLVVGVFRMDGKRFVMATEGGNAAGEVAGDQLEICITDNIPDYVGAICTIYKRQ